MHIWACQWCRQRPTFDRLWLDPLSGACSGVQVAQGFGMLLGTVTMNAKTAQTIASIVVLAFILTGGYFVRGARSSSPTSLTS